MIKEFFSSIVVCRAQSKVKQREKVAERGQGQGGLSLASTNEFLARAAISSNLLTCNDQTLDLCFSNTCLYL